MNKIKLKVVGLLPGVSPTGAHALLLADEANHYSVPVIIGAPEARAIAMQMEHLQMRRPMTHDLMKSLMDKAGATLLEVYIHRWEAGVYFAELRVDLPGGETRVDARVSDAVALALRFSVPVYMAGEVLEKTALVISNGEIVPRWTLEGEKTPREETARLRSLPDEELTRLMKEAVAGEDYEQASRYRDELKIRKNK
ncbi:MAG: bifunctional nuclease family protein [Odoribacteraceae bacterium]|jgi:bifunctional DNase/RNase|nr:bifunctional nuclease family protein [Odoribacteraceae bacterium]